MNQNIAFLLAKEAYKYKHAELKAKGLDEVAFKEAMKEFSFGLFQISGYLISDEDMPLFSEPNAPKETTISYYN